MNALTSAGVADGARIPESPAGKRYMHGTHRTCTPEDTLARLHPLLGRFGITRVANVSGLDRAGLPVVAVHRPNARSVTIAQGKGATLTAARVSALMESIEVWHAEHIINPVKLASTHEMRAAHRIADLDGLPRSRDSRYDTHLPLLWIEGEDLMGGGRAWLPYELVSANYTLPLPPGSGCFQANTNGLASGNQHGEALVHALCEAIERDARTLWQQQGSRGARRTLVDAASVTDPLCRSVLDRYAHADLEVRIWEATTDVGVACFVCALRARDGDEVDPEFGSGCHTAREVALLRALTEAAQSRNTYITAARDDYMPELYTSVHRERRRRYFDELYTATAPVRNYAHVPTYESTSVESDLRWLLARLRAAGIEQALAVDLTRESIGIPVVRVVIPGLEGALDDTYAPGVRARRAAGGRS